MDHIQLSATANRDLEGNTFIVYHVYTKDKNEDIVTIVRTQDYRTAMLAFTMRVDVLTPTLTSPRFSDNV